MADIKSLEEAKDFFQPGLNWINDKNETDYKTIIDGTKLKLNNGFVVLDNSFCKTSDDQIKEINKAFKELR